MLAGIIFLGSIVGMVLLVGWAVKNDGAGPTGKTTGLLAMTAPDDEEKAPEKKPPPYIR